MGVEVVNDGCKMAFLALSKQSPAPAPKILLPIPRSLLFMGNFESLVRARNVENRVLDRELVNEMAWQQWANNYNHDFPQREAAGYGPGAMVVVPKP